jgi:CelD/BcsL family acetyltransferase involved in cellulose biosynthesis
VTRWRNVLIAAVITDAYKLGLAEVDFLRGDEEYKDSFAPEQRELLRLRGANGRAGRVALIVDTAARKTKRLVGRLVSGSVH